MAAAEHGPGPTIEYLWCFDVAAAPDDLWRFVSDTSRMNRALGTAQMTFAPEGGRLVGRSRNGGVRHEWIEEPWDWVTGQWMSNVRVYSKGFVRLVRGVQRIEATPGGARLYTYFGFVPRGWLGALGVRLGFPSLQKGYAKLLPALAAEARQALPRALFEEGPPLGDAAADRLRALREVLGSRGLDAALVERLVDWVRSGDEQDLVRIQVRERALAWPADEDRVLSLFLHANRAGLLDLSWDVVCPHCRAPAAEHGRADDIGREGACEVCAIEFGTDDAIEVTFHVHPSIRAIERRQFCSAEPAYKSHIRLQRRLPPGGEAAVSPALSPGRWRMRLQGQGPCIAVRLNANIDYFGGTVNVAAKLQSLAESWQVAMARSTLDSPGVADWVRAQGGTVEDEVYTSKALPEPVPVKRWTVRVGEGPA